MCFTTLHLLSRVTFIVDTEYTMSYPKRTRVFKEADGHKAFQQTLASYPSELKPIVAHFSKVGEWLTSRLTVQTVLLYNGINDVFIKDVIPCACDSKKLQQIL